MDNEIKVSLTVKGIPGKTRHYVGKIKSRIFIDVWDKKAKKMIQKAVFFKIPKYEYATIYQTIKLTKAFYDYAISTECPNWFNFNGSRKDLTNKWSRMKKEERLEAHLHNIMEDLGGTDYIYNVFED